MSRVRKFIDGFVSICLFIVFMSTCGSLFTLTKIRYVNQSIKDKSVKKLYPVSNKIWNWFIFLLIFSTLGFINTVISIYILNLWS